MITVESMKDPTSGETAPEFPIVDECNPVTIIARGSIAMGDNQPWEFTCKTCVGHVPSVVGGYSLLIVLISFLGKPGRNLDI
jgi:hypothetical protein